MAQLVHDLKKYSGSLSGPNSAIIISRLQKYNKVIKPNASPLNLKALCDDPSSCCIEEKLLAAT